MPLEVNLVNLLDVLQKVTDVDNLGLHLGVPKHELDEIKTNFHRTQEQKRGMVRWWLNNDLNPTWERVIAALKAMHKPVLADAVAVVSKWESLHEPPTEELQRGDKMIVLLDEKIQEIQQRSQYLGKEWEKGEEEWRKFLKEMKKIEEVWEDLVKSQQTERAFLTLGISSSCHSDLELLDRTDVLKEKAETLIATSRQLRELYEKATQHQSGLQITETELEAWERVLIEHEVGLQDCIDQMEELGEKFSGEAKDCRKQLEKSRERLQTCSSKMRECRDELTKSCRQLQKCQEKLTECEVSLKRCRDELGNNHLQIAKCIEGLKKESEDLSAQIAALTVGTARGAGVGFGAAIGMVGGPIGMAVGALIGGAVGLETGGYTVAYVQGENLDKARKKLRNCESELIDCDEVVERCRVVLQKSEDELKDLKEVVNELKEFLSQ